MRYLKHYMLIPNEDAESGIIVVDIDKKKAEQRVIKSGEFKKGEFRLVRMYIDHSMPIGGK